MFPNVLGPLLDSDSAGVSPLQRGDHAVRNIEHDDFHELLHAKLPRAPPRGSAASAAASRYRILRATGEDGD